MMITWTLFIFLFYLFVDTKCEANLFVGDVYQRSDQHRITISVSFSIGS